MSAEPLRLVPKAPPALSALPPIEPSERRKHALVNSYWHSLKGERAFPSIWDLDPFEIADAGPNSVMLDLSKDRDNPEIFVGEALRYDGKTNNDLEHQEDAKSLLSCVLNHYRNVLGKSGPIAFEDKCAADGHTAISCFGTLFPFSSTGESIDYVYGLLSWKHVVLEEALEEAATAAVAAEELPPIETAAVEEPVAEEPVQEAVVEPEPVAVVEETTVEPEPVVEEAAAEPEPVVEETAVEPEPVSVVEEAVVEPEPVAVVEEAVVEPEPVAVVEEEPVEIEAALPVEEVADVLAAEADVGEMLIEVVVAEEPTIETAAEEVVEEIAEDVPVVETPEEILAVEEAMEVVPEVVETAREPVIDEVPEYDPIIGPPIEEYPEPAGKGDDLRSQFSAFGSAVFAAVKKIAVANDAVSFAPEKAPASVQPAPAPEPEPVAVAPVVEAEPELIDIFETASEADLEPVAELASDEPDVMAFFEQPMDLPEMDDVAAAEEEVVVEEAAIDEPVIDEVEMIAEEPVALEPVAEEPIAEEFAPEPVAATTPGIFMPMVPFEHRFEEEAAEQLEEAVADADHGAMVAQGVVVPMLALDAEVEEEAASASTPPQRETADAEPVAREMPIWRSDAPPVPEASVLTVPVRNDDLRRQLAVAQALAASVPDADYHGRGALYVALGHAYDFALTADAQPEACRAIFEEAGLGSPAKASMGQLVDLVFGSNLERERLNQFASLLTWAQRAKLQPGTLASHLEFLEAGMAIVSPR